MNRAFQRLGRASAIIGGRGTHRSFHSAVTKSGASGKTTGPYAVPHHKTNISEAHLFGINPNVPYKNEGWEYITIGTYVICFGIILVGCSTKSLDSFKVWARTEAIARRKVIAEGGEIKFGTWYSQPEYEVEEGDLDEKPVPKEM